MDEKTIQLDFDTSELDEFYATLIPTPRQRREFLIDKDVTYRVKSRKGKTITLEVVL